MLSSIKKEQRVVIAATTIGSILEWYEVFLYAYWAPVLSRHFFNSNSEIAGEINTLILFAIGFLSRPVGGIVFGIIGDRLGRKIAFCLSIISVAIPSFAIGLLPSYATIGFLSPLLLGLMRFLQGFPAGGEIPGAMCYLSETASPKSKKYMGSYTFFGVQIGVIIGILEYFLFEKFISPEILVTQAWRYSFILSGLLGLLGFYLRHKMKETPLFKTLELESKLLHKPFIHSVKKYKKKLIVGFFSCFLATVGFFTISLFPGLYLRGNSINQNLNNPGYILIMLGLSTISLPFLGSLGDRFKIESLLKKSAACIILLSPLFFYSIKNNYFIATLLIETVIVFLLSIQFALLPSLLAELYPTSIRYTCIGLSFNLCDSIIGGMTPIFILYLIAKTNSLVSWPIFIGISGILSFCSFFFLKEKSNKMTLT